MDKIKINSILKGYEKLDLVAFYVLLAVIFLLPIFFVPYLQISLLVGKGFLVFIGVIISFFLWLLARLVEGKIYIPKQRILLLGFGIPFILTLSSLFSPSFRNSFLGSEFEINTVIGMVVMFLLLFLSLVFFQSKKRIFMALGSIGISFTLVTVFNLVNLFLHLSTRFPKIFTQISGGSLLGTWNDFAIFTGFVTILLISCIEILPIVSKKKWILYIIFVLSLFFLAISNLFIIWLIVGLFALFIFVYLLVFSEREKNTIVHFPAISFVTILVSLIFLLTNNFFGSYLSNKFKIPEPEIRPSLSSTYSVAKSVFLKKAVLGVGPNRFSQGWDLYRPSDTNNSRFWDVSFGGVSGWIPTFAVTAGILGIIIWLTFLFYFFIKGFKSLFVASGDKIYSFISISSFLGSLYLWIVSIVLFPNITTVALAFVMTGLCIGSWQIKKTKNISLSFIKDPRASFFSILILLILMLGIVSVGYMFVEKYISVIYFEKAINNTSLTETESLDNAEVNILKAINLYPSDIYYRTLSQIYVGKFNMLMGQNGLSSEALKPELQTLVNNAESSALLSIKSDNKNYLNWINLAQVYESFISVGIKGSYENTISSYEKALTLNPKNVSIYFAMTKIELLQKNIEKAKSYADKALSIKPDYADIWILLGQYYEQIGNNSESLNYYKKAMNITSNPFVFKEIQNYISTIQARKLPDVSIAPTVTPPVLKNGPVKKK